MMKLKNREVCFRKNHALEYLIFEALTVGA